MCKPTEDVRDLGAVRGRQRGGNYLWGLRGGVVQCPGGYDDKQLPMGGSGTEEWTENGPEKVDTVGWVGI